ncbi:MAG: nucleotidyltransferase family protein [Chloroflexota bacterium]
MSVQIAIPEQVLAEFCRRYHIGRLSLFGSVLRDDFRADSDVDVLIEFEPGKTVDFFTFSDMQDELSTILGYEVDLNTPNFLSRYFRDQVIQQARVLYEPN